jgi:hypothetical protein
MAIWVADDSGNSCLGKGGGRAMRPRPASKNDDFASADPTNFTKLTAFFFAELFRYDQARS